MRLKLSNPAALNCAGFFIALLLLLRAGACRGLGAMFCFSHMPQFFRGKTMTFCGRVYTSRVSGAADSRAIPPAEQALKLDHKYKCGDAPYELIGPKDHVLEDGRAVSIFELHHI